MRIQAMPLDFKWTRDYGQYFYLGLMFPSSMIVGMLLGYLVDKYFHTDPWGKLIGLFLGVVAGAVNFVRDYKRLVGKKNNESKKS
jgi:ATP synthase protein I